MPVLIIVQIVKSITAKKLFSKHSEIKKMLWGGHLRTSGFYVNTVGQFVSEDTIKKYVQNQGKTYKKTYSGQIKLDL